MHTNPYFYPYNLYNQNWSRITGNAQLVRDIQKAINGEYSAISCYEKLANLATTEEERDQILEIRNDEIRHLDQFTRIYTRLTGGQPKLELSEECPDAYNEGIKFAFKDEQETVDFYLNIAEKSTDPLIKDAFKRAAADEQNHAVWFLYFYKS